MCEVDARKTERRVLDINANNWADVLWTTTIKENKESFFAQSYTRWHKPISGFVTFHIETHLSKCNLKQTPQVGLNVSRKNWISCDLWLFRLQKCYPVSMWIGWKSDFGWQSEHGFTSLTDFYWFIIDNDFILIYDETAKTHVHKHTESYVSHIWFSFRTYISRIAAFMRTWKRAELLTKNRFPTQ